MKRNSLTRGVSIYDHILFTPTSNIRHKLRWKNRDIISRFDCTSTNSRPNAKYVTSLKTDKFAFRNWFLILPYRSVIAYFSLPSSFVVFGVHCFLSFLPPRPHFPCWCFIFCHLSSPTVHKCIVIPTLLILTNYWSLPLYYLPYIYHLTLFI